jgi:hypothetical protein
VCTPMKFELERFLHLVAYFRSQLDHTPSVAHVAIIE